MTGFAKRVSAVTILPEIEPAICHFLALGFQRKDSDSPHCVGLRAGDSYMILITTALMAADHGEEMARNLSGRTLPYIWVESLDHAMALMPDTAMVAGRGRLSTGEVLVQMDGQWMILAER